MSQHLRVQRAERIIVAARLPRFRRDGSNVLQQQQFRIVGLDLA
jgi:hypothetical protein